MMSQYPGNVIYGHPSNCKCFLTRERGDWVCSHLSGLSVQPGNPFLPLQTPRQRVFRQVTCSLLKSRFEG